MKENGITKTPAQRPGVVIAGSGRYLPERLVTNKQLVEMYGLDSSDEWIQKNLGIRERHFADESEASSDLGAKAALLALEEAGIEPEAVDRIVFCSSTHDWTSPAAASNLQRLIGATCPAVDLQSACASFLFGLDYGIRMIETGCRFVLVVAAEVKSRFVRKNDLRLAPIFADGAGAVLLTPGDPQVGMLECELWTDGTKVQNMITPAGGSAMPASAQTVAEELHTTRMQVDGKTIYDDAVREMVRLSHLVCSRRRLTPADVDLFIPHQANRSIMGDVATRLGISDEKVVVTIDRTANIVSATIPYALDTAFKEGRLRSGSIVLMVAVGAGYAGGAALYRVP